MNETWMDRFARQVADPEDLLPEPIFKQVAVGPIQDAVETLRTPHDPSDLWSASLLHR